MKIKKERFSVACSRCRQNLKFGDFTWSLYRVPQEYVVESVLHVQHDYLCSFKPMISLFCAVVVAIAVVKS